MTRPPPRATLLAALLGACTSPPALDETRLADPAEAFDRESVETPPAVPLQVGRGEALQNFNLILGIRHMENDVWGELDDQPVIGFEFDRRSRNSALGFEVGFSSAYDWQSVGIADLETWSFELYAGPRVTLGDPNSTFHPYVGAGVSWFYTDLETFTGVTQRDSDDSFAGYAHTGVYFDAGGSTNIGVDLRGMFGSDLKLSGISADGDYYQIALILGSGW